MFGYSNNSNQQYTKVGFYNTMEECAKDVEVLEQQYGYQYYVVYEDEGLHNENWEYNWREKKVLVSRLRFDARELTNSRIPVPLYHCVSNNLDDFYFH